MTHFLDKKTLMLLYYAYIDSVLIYALPIWGSASQKYLDKLQILQNKTVKIIENRPYLTPTIELYSADFISFKQKCVYEAIFFIYKIKNNLIKTNFIITDNFVITNTQTRNKHKIRLPRYTMAISQKSIFYRGVKLFNQSSTEITEPKPLTDFKKQFKRYVFTNFELV